MDVSTPLFVICAICGSKNYQPLYHPRHSPGPVVKCTTCGLVYVSPRTDQHAIINEGPVLADRSDPIRFSSDLADIEHSWELPLLHRKERELAALRLNATDALQRIGRFVSHLDRLLDFGCGGGFFLAVAKDYVTETYGLEPLPGHAVYARATSGAVIINDTLRENTFPREHFDVITSFQVFEHLPDPSGDMRKLYQFLKPQGLLFVEVPNIDVWTVRLLGRRHRHFVEDHLYFYSPSTLSRLMIESGFSVVDVYYPARRMTVHHLLVDWVVGKFSYRLSKSFERLLKQLRLGQRIISVSIRDIIVVIGRKESARGIANGNNEFSAVQ